MSCFARFTRRKISPIIQCFARMKPGRSPQRTVVPFYHVLNECKIPGLEQDFALIDFHALFTLSVQLAQEFANQAGSRVRLLPPYREHLSQSFARLFMRVGLPTDIPPFTKKK